MSQQPLFDQYSEQFGVTFSLEDGSPVKLAEVGGVATAFGGAYGNDTPAPGQGIGQFFLTDDGMLQGLSSTPIFIDFFFPMDSVSGCILDMDFQERFIVTAYGEFGERQEHDKPMLYNLSHDAAEKFDIAKEHSEILSQIWELVATHKSKLITGEDMLADWE